jgi:SsrA-binding protein
MANPQHDRSLAENRQAFHNYHVLERLEAGMELAGSEVKALRAGEAQLKDSYVIIRSGEAWLLNCHIGAYRNAGYAGHEPERTRKLLLNRQELHRLEGKTREKGLTIVPLRLYLRGRYIKCEIGLVKGKQLYDKRETERRREAEREARQAMKERGRR